MMTTIMFFFFGPDDDSNYDGECRVVTMMMTTMRIKMMISSPQIEEKVQEVFSRGPVMMITMIMTIMVMTPMMMVMVVIPMMMTMVMTFTAGRGKSPGGLFKGAENLRSLSFSYSPIRYTKSSS